MTRFYFVPLLALCSFAYSQKTTVCKKGKIKVNDAIVGEYNGKGGVFKSFIMGVFAPAGKDTLISVTSDYLELQDPMFEDVDMFKLNFTDAAKTSISIKNTSGYRASERTAIDFIFNDTVPGLLSSGKLDADGIKKFKEKYAFDFEGYRSQVKATEDTLTKLSAAPIKRDAKKPFIFKKIIDNSNTNAKYAQYNDYDETYEIYQDNVLLGRLHKTLTTGMSIQAQYTYWKAIPYYVMDGSLVKYSPLAILNTNSGSLDAPAAMVIYGKQWLAVKKGAYNQLEYNICQALIDKGLF